MKTIFNYLKFAVLSVVVACTLTSCEDDDSKIDDGEIPDIESPTVNITYSITAPTYQNVSVTLTFNEAVSPIEGWSVINDRQQSKIYMENIVETVIFEDTAGNKGSTQIEINNIDKKGILILNEGSWGGNNTTISFYGFNSGTTYFDITNATLGDTGMDILIHGSKVYVTVSTSGTIVVFDKESKVKIKTIGVKDDAGQSRAPHYLTAYAGKVYATTFDGNVVRIDTTSLNIDGITSVGANPEGIAYAQGKLYVANSGGLDYANIDNTLSVIGVTNFQEEERITVGKNPYILKADNSGNIFITCRSIWKPDFSGIETPGCFQYLNTQTKEVTTISDVAALKIAVDGDFCYYYDDSSPVNVGVYNAKTKSIEKQFITDGTSISTPYGIGVDPETKEVYISETDYTTPGSVYVFDSNGKKQRKLDVGISANTFAFYR